MVQRALNQHMEEKLEAELWAAIEKRYPEQFKEYREGKIDIVPLIQNFEDQITAEVVFHYPTSSKTACYEYRKEPTLSYWYMVRDWND